MRLRPLPSHDEPRKIVMRDGTIIHYRLNRGDIQSIREVFLDECYRLPEERTYQSLLDLGANIGLTTLWLQKRYHCKNIVAVEPSPENMAFVRRNIDENKIAAELVEAAVGPRDGIAHFQKNTFSNQGSVSDQGDEVKMVSMPTLLAKFPTPFIDLMKLDIEGGEGPLLKEGNIDWLQQIGAITSELHPPIIDYAEIVSILENSGMRYRKPGADTVHSLEFFVR